MELQRIPRAGEQPMPKEQWEALITREATAYFDKLDVSGCLRIAANFLASFLIS